MTTILRIPFHPHRATASNPPTSVCHANPPWGPVPPATSPRRTVTAFFSFFCTLRAQTGIRIRIQRTLQPSRTQVRATRNDIRPFDLCSPHDDLDYATQITIFIFPPVRRQLMRTKATSAEPRELAIYQSSSLNMERYVALAPRALTPFLRGGWVAWCAREWFDLMTAICALGLGALRRVGPGVVLYGERARFVSPIRILIKAQHARLGVPSACIGCEGSI